MIATGVFLTAAAVAGGVIAAAGGAAGLEVWLLALCGALSFGDLARRAAVEPDHWSGDVTDWLTTLAFLAILLGGAYDLGHRSHASAGAPGVAVRAFGFVVIVFGLWLRTRAARTLGRSFSVRLGVHQNQALIESGPYRWVRHPNYAGLLAVAVGTSLALASPLALLATFTLWLPSVIFRIAREETLMRERFGEAYRSYSRRSWCLIVGVF